MNHGKVFLICPYCGGIMGECSNGIECTNVKCGFFIRNGYWEYNVLARRVRGCLLDYGNT